MSTDARRDVGLCALLGVAALPVLFYGLGAYSPVHMDELLYHGVARHMLASGDYFRLVFGGESRSYDALMNAPIHYWAKALVIAALGDGRVSMRLLSAGFGLASVCLLALCVSRMASRRAGLLAGLLMLTTFQFVHLHGARTGEMETIIVFLFVATAVLFLSAVDGRRGFWPHHLCLVALAHLKLPLIALPIAAELAYFAWVRASRSGLNAWLWTGLAALPLLLVWRVFQIALYPNEALDVATLMWAQATGDAPKVARDHVGLLGNAIFYLRTFLFGAFPMILVAPVALASLVRAGPSERGDAPWRLFALNILAVVLFFFVVSKHFPWYVMPAHAFLCALVAVWLDRHWQRSLAPGAALGLSLAVAVAIWLRFPGLAYDPFTEVVRRVPEIRWASYAVFGVPISALGIYLVLRRLPTWSIAPGVAVLLLLIGGARVVAPLRYVEHESEIEKLRAHVDRERAQGATLPNPILYTREPNESGLTRVWYFFGDEYWVVPQREAGKRTRVVALYDRRLAAPPGVNANGGVGETH